MTSGARHAGRGLLQVLLTGAVGTLLLLAGVLAEQRRAGGEADQSVLPAASTAADSPIPAVRTLFTSPVVAVGAQPGPIAPADFDADGWLDLVVAELAGDQIALLRGDGLGRHVVQSRIPIPNGLVFVAAGEFDSDGVPDLAIVTDGTSPHPPADVEILRGLGGGGFAAPIRLGIGAQSMLSVGDLDGDGKDDLLVIGTPPEQVLLVFGTGDGTFDSPVGYPVGAGIASVGTGDLEGDGDLDILAAVADTVAVLVNHGGRAFSGPVLSSAGGYLSAFAVEDFDGDGLLDLVACAGDGLGLMRGAGGGVFGGSEVVPGVDNPTALVLGRFDHDANPDAVVVRAAADEAVVLHGSGDGTLEHAGSFPTGRFPAFVVAGDFDGDARIDLALSDRYSDEVRVFLGHPEGRYGAHGVVAPTWREANQVRAADFNLDGYADLAVVSRGQQVFSAETAIYLGRPDGRFQAGPVFLVGLEGSVVVVGDLDGDGRVDLAGVEPTGFGSEGPNVYVFQGRGDGSFSLRRRYQFPRDTVISDAHTADVNGDGADDIAVLAGGTVRVLAMSGASAVTSIGATSIPSATPRALALGHLDGDAVVDAAVALTGGRSIALRGEGNGRFVTSASLQAGTELRDVTIADLDADGTGDIVVVDERPSMPTGAAHVFYGAGGGFYEAPRTIESGYHARVVEAADLDGDGDDDLAILNSGRSNFATQVLSGDVSIYLSQEGRRIEPHGRFSAGFVGFARSVAIARFDAGAAPDVVIANWRGATVLFNRGFVDDADEDGVPDAADPCTDTDGDGFGNPWYPGECLPDTCPHHPGGSQADVDGDGLGDPCDSCPADPTNDVDGDGVCEAVDTCPGVANPTQTDGDDDGVGDPCDPCVDPDGDGFGEPGNGSAEACPPDNCPRTANPDQADLDGDGMGDACRPGDVSGTFENRANATGTYPWHLAVGDLDADEAADVVVYNLVSRDVTIFRNRGDGSLAERSHIPVGEAFAGIALADVNGDSRLDLVTAVSPQRRLDVRLGLGDGSFEGPIQTDLGAYLDEFAVRDLNADGRPDLVIEAIFPARVSILLGQGDGTFLSGQEISVGTVASDFAVADFNGDGTQDLAIADSASDVVRVLLGAGNGSFGSPISSPAGDGPILLAAGHANPDGLQDLFVVTSYSVLGIEREGLVLMGNGDGTFRSSLFPFRSGPGRPQDLIAADLNADGLDDVVVTEPDEGWISVSVGPWDGPNYPEGFIVMIQDPRVVLAEDMSGNGTVDLVVTNASADTVWSVEGNGDGTFGPEPVHLGYPAFGAVVDDFNGDQRPDVALDRGWVFPGVGQGRVGSRIPLDAEAPFSFLSPTFVASGDFNSDARRDLAITFSSGISNFSFGQVDTFLGRGDGTAYERRSVTAGADPFAVAVGDWNLDGRDDLAVANVSSADIDIFLGDGAGGFSPSGSYVVGDAPFWIAAGDLDGDGRPDLAVATAGSDYPPPGIAGHVTVLVGTGDGGFRERNRIPAGLYPVAVVIADLGEAGHADLAVANYGSHDVTVLPGRGDATFGSPLHFSVGYNPYSLTATDVNSDGRLDLVTANFGSGDVSVLPGAGDGTFGPESRFGVGGGTTFVATGHFDEDRRPDIAVVSHATLVILRNYGPFPDSDGDGSLDPDDSCTDSDHDGWGDPFLATNACATDNCPASPNAAQTDSDADGRGDACDRCAADPDDDGDRDEICGNLDNCAVALNHDQSNRDGDVFGDACDNCPGDSSPDPTDSNGDGAGDACQPRIVIEEIRQDGGEALEVFLEAKDPQGTPLSGTVEVRQVLPQWETMQDLLTSESCFSAYLPEGISGEGIAFVNGSAGAPYIGDLDVFSEALGLICGDRRGPDYWLGRGPCQGTQEDIEDAFLELRGLSLPATICVTRGTGEYSHPPPGSPRFEIELQWYDLYAASFVRLVPRVVAYPFAGGLPRTLGLHSLSTGGNDELTITVTDGNTPPVSASSPFEYQGESLMVLYGDSDGDGIPDRTDPCTDTDGDGFGDPGYPENSCADDHCPSVHDPGQSDSDADGFGDACDNCAGMVNEGQEDGDADGVGDLCDDCPTAFDPAQTDDDGDGVGEGCDNCPGLPNGDQGDSNADGFGDACQPTVAILGISEDGGDLLEVTIAASDPQGEPLTGTVRIFGTAPGVALALLDLSADPRCDAGWSIDAVPGRGLGYAYSAFGEPVLFDLDSALGCQDFAPDYLLADGPCATTAEAFGPTFPLSGRLFPLRACARKAGEVGGGLDLLIDSADPYALFLRPFEEFLAFEGPIDGPLPRTLTLVGLQDGSSYRLLVELTDGTTLPVQASVMFLYRGETGLLLRGANAAPNAVPQSEGVFECSSAQGAIVRLDGSASADPDSSPGSNDDIVLFEWFENFGTATQRLLGTGETLTASLPLGAHAITLRVTDTQGASDTAEAVATVHDTTPPALSVGTDPAVLWPPNHRLVPVGVVWQTGDACDPAPAVRLMGVTSSEPDDLPGTGDGETEGDIAGAGVGEPEGEVLLRAERSASGAGRGYELVYMALDASGNTASAVTLVTVPHDLGEGPDPLRVRAEPGTEAGAVRWYWSPVAGVESYDVITGDVGALRLEEGRVRLGTVTWPARGLTGTVWQDSGTVVPPPGKARFYLVQWQAGGLGSGFGTESVPWPREPETAAVAGGDTAGRSR